MKLEFSLEKIQVSQDDLAELSQTAKPDVESSVSEENISEDGNVSLDEVSQSEKTTTTNIIEPKS